jgi:hypothetical protein
VADLELRITQSESELKIERRAGGRAQTLVYRLDGSESLSPGGWGGDVRSTSRWEGDRLITESSQTMNTPRGSATLEMREVRMLAEGGAMVVETIARTPRGTETRKLVFVKRTT